MGGGSGRRERSDRSAQARRERRARGWRDRSLAPTSWERISAAWPFLHGTRALFARRAGAAVLLVLAGLLALQPEGTSQRQVRVVVAARDLPPGRVLGETDLLHRAVPAALVPRGAVLESDAARGRTLASAARGGEPLTDLRLAGPELTRITAGADRVAVPVRLADPGIADLLVPGRRVDLVTAPGLSSAPSVLAENAPVIMVRPGRREPDQGRLVVIGLPEQEAPAVAAASLIQTVTVTLR